MRQVDKSKIYIKDPDWHERAKAATLEVASGKKANDFSSVWQETKPIIKDIMNGKCWYCESRQERSDNAVDHFRPKSTYPWLAFELDNYRYVCTFCNSKRKNPDTGETSGKGEHFPIYNGSRATNATEIDQEDVVLLDPCRGGDPALIDFTDDGRVCSKYPNSKKRNDRALKSIKYYHLDHPDLNEARRKLAVDIRALITATEASYNRLDQGNPEEERAFTCNCEVLGRKINECAEFSVFAKKIISGFREHEWIEDMLFTV